MKHDEFDLHGLSLKTYRDSFGKNVSLDVLKRAYDYSKNGHLPQNSIATSAAIYAEPFKKHTLRQLGLMAQRELNSVTIWNIQTETPAAQRLLLQGEWDFHNRPMCIARLGENYDCTCRTTLQFPNRQIIGVYQHQHRFVAIVSLKQLQESASCVAKVQEIANNLAINIIVHYPAYLVKKEIYELRIKRHLPAPEPLPEFKEFLLQQPLRFVDNINNESSLFYNPARAVTIGDYLKRHSDELHQELKIANIHIFGDF